MGEELKASPEHCAYIPPELAECQQDVEGFSGELCATQVDCFQVGVAIFAVLVGEYPVLKFAEEGVCDLSSYLDRLSAPCCDLLEKLLAPCSAERLTVKGALEHEWFLQS